MKNVIFALVALLLVVSLSEAQTVSMNKYYIYVSAKNTIDTIPGHQVGASGAGYAGWLYVGNDDVYATYWALDSTQSAFTIDYADSGVSSGLGSSSRVIPFATITAAAGDTLFTADATGDIGLVKRTIRDQVTNNIGGARWIRFRVANLNADNFAAAAGDRVLRLTVIRKVR